MATRPDEVMAPRRPDFNILQDDTYAVARKKRSYVDLDAPVDTKSSYHNQSGVKRLGEAQMPSGFGVYRILKRGSSNSTAAHPAYTLEDKDNAAWTAALQELDRNVTPMQKRRQTAPPQVKNDDKPVPAFDTVRKSHVPHVLGTPSNSETKPTTDSSDFSHFLSKKRKIEELPALHTETHKRRAGHVGCTVHQVKVKNDPHDIVMCMCDDPLHTLSDE